MTQPIAAKPRVRPLSSWEEDWSGKPWCYGTVTLAESDPVMWRAYAGCLDPREPVLFIWGEDGSKLRGPTPEADAAVREFALARLN